MENSEKQEAGIYCNSFSNANNLFIDLFAKMAREFVTVQEGHILYIEVTRKDGGLHALLDLGDHSRVSIEAIYCGW